jgi:hypothetical protein
MVFCRLTFAFTAVVEGQHQVVNLNVAQIAVLHIPHSCKFVPVEGRQALRLDNAALDNELLRMTDNFTDELFPVTQVEAGRWMSRSQWSLAGWASY